MSEYGLADFKDSGCESCVFNIPISGACEFNEMNLQKPMVPPCTVLTTVILVHKLSGIQVKPEELVKYYAK